MRNFVVTWLERLLGLLLILSVLGVLLAAWSVGTSARAHAVFGAITVLAGGAVSIILGFGMAYVALAIHANTRRTANAVEALLRQGDPRKRPVMGTTGGVAAPVGAEAEAAPAAKPKPRPVGPVSRDIPRR